MNRPLKNLYKLNSLKSSRVELFFCNFAPAKARGGENVVPLHGRPATAHLKA